MMFLSSKIEFPKIETATEEGLVALGGDLSIERLMLAYKLGIFPWYNKEEPILWWSPDPRMVLYPHELKVSKSMKKLFRDKKFSVTTNKNFRKVIVNCSQIKRNDQEDTWITDEMIEAYCELHQKGIAMSVEVWLSNELVGGLYGIDLKEQKVFCGESMFSKISNASKYGFITLVKMLQEQNYKLIDCQVHTNHLESLGAKEISRTEFLSYL